MTTSRACTFCAWAGPAHKNASSKRMRIIKTNIRNYKYEKEFGWKWDCRYFRAAMLNLKHTKRIKKQSPSGKAA
jgi:hypothetical protein